MESFDHLMTTISELKWKFRNEIAEIVTEYKNRYNLCNRDLARLCGCNAKDILKLSDPETVAEVTLQKVLDVLCYMGYEITLTKWDHIPSLDKISE